MIRQPMTGSARDLATYADEGFGRRLIAETADGKVMLVAFRPGQGIPAHAPDAALVITVMDGDGTIRIGDDFHHLRAGDIATVPAGVVRAINAGAAGMVAMHTVSPVPTEADHSMAVSSEPWPDDATGIEVAEAVSEEHSHLRPQIDAFGSLADRWSDLEASERSDRLHSVVDFLQNHLLPHAAAEEAVLYPAVERVLRARGGATSTMTLDHAEIARLTESLSKATPEAAEIPGLLHSLRALVLLHLEEEEQVYLPALAGLGAAEAEALAEALGFGAGEQAHHHV